MLTSSPLPDVVNIAIPVSVALLTVPTLKHLLARKRGLSREYELVGGDVADTAHYQDRNGEATEASTKALTDSRAKISLWLGVLISLEASLTIELVNRFDFGTHRAFLVQESDWDTPPSWTGTVITVCSHSIQALTLSGWIIVKKVNSMA